MGYSVIIKVGNQQNADITDKSMPTFTKDYDWESPSDKNGYQDRYS